MEVEENGSICFLNLMVTRKHNETLNNQSFRKKTRIEKYPHVDSHHCPYQYIWVLNMLTIGVVRISVKKHLKQEHKHLTKDFKSTDTRIITSKELLKESGWVINLIATNT